MAYKEPPPLQNRSTMKTVVITGGSGLLALNWAVHRRHTDKIHLWTNSRDVTVPGSLMSQVNLENRKTVGKMLDRVQPDYVVNAAAYTDVDGCQKDVSRSHKANVVVAKNIAHETHSRAIKMIQISTDQLFDSSSSMSEEGSLFSPMNFYGMHKAQAEGEVSSVNDSALIVRTSFFGWGPKYRRSFSDKIIDSLQLNERVFLFDDVFLVIRKVCKD